MIWRGVAYGTAARGGELQIENKWYLSVNCAMNKSGSGYWEKFYGANRVIFFDFFQTMKTTASVSSDGPGVVDREASVGRRGLVESLTPNGPGGPL